MDWILWTLIGLCILTLVGWWFSKNYDIIWIGPGGTPVEREVKMRRAKQERTAKAINLQNPDRLDHEGAERNRLEGNVDFKPMKWNSKTSRRIDEAGYWVFIGEDGTEKRLTNREFLFGTDEECRIWAEDDLNKKKEKNNG